MCIVSPQIIMKKVQLLICAIFLSLVANAQFILTPNDFVDKTKPDNSYLVFDFDGKTQKEIYELALNSLIQIYNSPKDVISKAEYTGITVTGIGSEKVAYKIWGYDIYYSLTLQFKDGKMKVDAPNIILIKHPNPKATISEISMKNIFDKNGEIKNEKTKTSIESYFNMLISRIVENMQPKKNENW